MKPTSAIRAAAKGLLALFVVLAGACCSAQQAPPEPTRNEVVTEPHGPVAVAPAPDCSQPPNRKCCESLAPECVACNDAGQAEADAWASRCEMGGKPLPATFDCNAPPPLTPCCRALLPKCTQCADRNRAIEEAYRAQCGPR